MVDFLRSNLKQNEPRPLTWKDKEIKGSPFGALTENGPREKQQLKRPVLSTPVPEWMGKQKHHNLLFTTFDSPNPESD